MTSRILAIIPARGGSKGIARKNIVDFFGKPLMAWSIDAALNSKYITHVVVSSEDEEILAIAQKFGANVVKRPQDLSSDISGTVPVIDHAVKSLALKGQVFDVLVLLQPTSPLRTSEDIDKSLNIYFNKGATGVVSGYILDSKCLKSFKLGDEGYLQGLSEKGYQHMRRQDLPTVFMPNGAIYVTSVSSFDSEASLYTDKTLPYFMSEELSIDIDVPSDLEKAREILRDSFL